MFAALLSQKKQHIFHMIHVRNLDLHVASTKKKAFGGWKAWRFTVNSRYECCRYYFHEGDGQK